MADILIRGLTDEAVGRIDAEAKFRRLSRNEYLRRRLEDERAPRGEISIDDLRRATEAVKDLDDPQVMRAAW
jgi:hypothetical protein